MCWSSQQSATQLTCSNRQQWSGTRRWQKGLWLDSRGKKKLQLLQGSNERWPARDGVLDTQKQCFPPASKSTLDIMTDV
jgi:hypothetical protein